MTTLFHPKDPGSSLKCYLKNTETSIEEIAMKWIFFHIVFSEIQPTYNLI